MVKSNNKCLKCNSKFPIISSFYRIVYKLEVSPKTIIEFNCTNCFLKEIGQARSSNIDYVVIKIGGNETTYNFNEGTKIVDIVRRLKLY